MQGERMDKHIKEMFIKRVKKLICTEHYGCLLHILYNSITSILKLNIKEISLPLKHKSSNIT